MALMLQKVGGLGYLKSSTFWSIGDKKIKSETQFNEEDEMKKIAMIITVLVVVAGLFSFASAAEKGNVRFYDIGNKGYIQYPWLEDKIALWSTKEMKGLGYLWGTVGPKTVVKVINDKKFKRKDLNSLNGKLALVIARMKRTGLGELGKTECLSLTVFLLPDSAEAKPVHQ